MKNKFILVLISSLFFKGTATSQSTLHLLSPEEISIDAYRNKTVHDPYLYPLDQHLSNGAKFNLNLNIIQYSDYKFYWNNSLHFDQSSLDQKIKHAGWWYFLGVTLLPKTKYSGGIDLFMEHHSRHILEETRENHFPVYDRYGIKIIFISK